ncbi:hypothetical protein EV182_002973, partial [Spiromyces aspiralis]
ATTGQTRAQQVADSEEANTVPSQTAQHTSSAGEHGKQKNGSTSGRRGTETRRMDTPDEGASPVRRRLRTRTQTTQSSENEEYDYDDDSNKRTAGRAAAIVKSRPNSSLQAQDRRMSRRKTRRAAAAAANRLCTPDYNDSDDSVNTQENCTDYKREERLLEAKIAYIQEEISAIEDQLSRSLAKARRLQIENDMLIDAIMRLPSK